MPDQIYIGTVKGLKENPLPFNIDNDAFPVLYNAYAWRGRIKRKRGTSFLGRFQRQVQLVAANPLPWQYLGPNLTNTSANAFYNLLALFGAPSAIRISNVTQATQAVVTVGTHSYTTGEVVYIYAISPGSMTQLNFHYFTIVNISATTITINVDSTGFTPYIGNTGIVSLAGGPSIVPGSISLVINGNTYTEAATPDGNLIGLPANVPAQINYATGILNVLNAPGAQITGTFSYYPDLPVLGLEDLVSNFSNSEFPFLLRFDDTYAYEINQTGVPFFYSVSYYKNTNNPVIWTNTDDNQFWSTNYQSAFWVTNSKAGFHFVNGTATLQTGTTITFNFKSGGNNFTTLIVGDVLWFNEWGGGSTINGLNGTVTNASGSASGNYVVTFDTSVTVSGTGIAQLLTNSIPNQDGIRWYDGDPTGANGIPPAMPTGLGWVNFAPPLTAISVTINDQTSDLYYLVGALAILPFKDRLLFFAPQIQSSTGPVIQLPLQDTVLWSWNGTPYYNALVPTNLNNTETFDVRAYYVDQTGFAGYLSAGISQPILTVMNNEDVLLIGFGGAGKKTRFVYTNNDLQPFLFYLINSQFPSASTFSAIVLDRGGIDIGSYGITMTTQQSCDRIDLDIPDEVFTIQALNNGQKRVNAVRDFFREWIYFSYPTGDGVATNQSYVYPCQSFLLNYRDQTWAIFRENFTHHGTFRRTTNRTWTTLPFPTWNSWTEPWSAGSTQALFPSIVAGNPQGFVLIKDAAGGGEGISGSVVGIQDDGMGFTQMTSINHCVNSGAISDIPSGDYLLFNNFLNATYLNGQIALVNRVIDADNFVVDIPFQFFDYTGLGTYARLSQPLIQTKQFPFYWEQGRQIRLQAQKYLFDKTADGEVTVNIYLSQDPNTIWNSGNIVPQTQVTNSSLIYSQKVYTCPESTNLGLTPANINLQTPTAAGQFQIWHRMNTSLIGESVQIGICLNDTQMRTLELATAEIALHAIQLTLSPGPLLS